MPRFPSLLIITCILSTKVHKYLSRNYLSIIREDGVFMYRVFVESSTLLNGDGVLEAHSIFRVLLYMSSLGI